MRYFVVCYIFAAINELMWASAKRPCHSWQDYLALKIVVISWPIAVVTRVIAKVMR